MNKARNGTCRLCLEKTNLKKSHTIGNSIFKQISKTMDGKAIVLSSGDDDIQYSSDSWSDYLLCSTCEHLLNDRYERYSLNILRGKHVTVLKTSTGIKFEKIEQRKLILYFLSIYWRAANSSHEAYSNVVILDSDNELLRNLILNDHQPPSGKFSIRISRVIDYNYPKKNTFSPQVLKQVIVSPYCNIYENYKLNNISVCYMFEGFFVEIFIPALKLKERKKPGTLSKTKTSLFVPYQDLFGLDKVVGLMAHNFGKQKLGKTRISKS